MRRDGTRADSTPGSLPSAVLAARTNSYRSSVAAISGEPRRTTLPKQRIRTMSASRDVGRVMRYSIESPSSRFTSTENKTPTELMLIVSPSCRVCVGPLRRSSNGSFSSKRLALRCSITRQLRLSVLACKVNTRDSRNVLEALNQGNVSKLLTLGGA